MPVQFPCPSCQQRLRISAKKIGAAVRCPRCQAEIMVPAESSQLPVAPLRPPPLPEALRQAPVADELPSERPSEMDSPAAEHSASWSYEPLPRRVDAPRQSMLLVPRRLIFLQAILISVVAMAAFLVGYFIGSGDGRQPPDAVGSRQ